MYRSCFDIYLNLYQHNVRRRRSRAVSRVPTTQVKHVLLKSKKVIIKVQKRIRKLVPHSSKLHAYLSKKSSVYQRLNNDFFAISDHKHKLTKKQRLGFNNLKHYCCFTKQQRFYSLFVQTRTPKHKKSVVCVYTGEQGSKKFQCSSVELLRVAHRVITLSGDIGCFPLCQRFRKFRSEIKWKGPFRFLLTGIFGITSGGGPDIPVGISRPKFTVPFAQFLVSSAALTSLARRTIMANVQSFYQCSICGHGTTDFLMHSCSAMTGMCLHSVYTKTC